MTDMILHMKGGEEIFVVMKQIFANICLKEKNWF